MNNILQLCVTVLISKKNTLRSRNIISEAEYNSNIEMIASQIVLDKTSLDEQDSKKLQKYYDFVKTNYKLEDEAAVQLINEAFLYLNLETAKDVDPLQEENKFGVGFS